MNSIVILNFKHCTFICLREQLPKICVYCVFLIPLSACSLVSKTETLEGNELFYVERDKGFKHYKQQNYSSAIKYYQVALTYLNEEWEDINRADIFYKLGRTYLKQQNYSNAIASFTQALQLQKTGNYQDLAVLHNMLGLVYQKTGQIDKSREHLQQALDYRYNSGDSLGEAKTLANLAATYLAQGAYLKAIEYYQKAQQLFVKETTVNSKDLGNILSNLGFVYAEMGQYSKALSFQHRALALFLQTNNLNGIAYSYHNVGYIKSVQKDYLAAVEAFNKAISLRQKINDRFGVAETRNNLGVVLNEMGQHKQALEVLMMALPMLQALNTKKQIAATYDSIAGVYAKTQDFSLALEAYQKALLIWRALGDRDNLRITLGNVGDLLTQSGQSVLAIIFYKQAVNITEEIREELHVLPKQAQKAYLNRVERFYRSLADLLLQQNRVIEAQQVLDLLKIQEVAGFLGPVRGNENTVKGILSLSTEQAIEQRYTLLQQQAIQVGKELTQLSNIAEKDRSNEQKRQFALLFSQEIKLRKAFQKFIESDEVLDLVDQLSRAESKQVLDLEKLESMRDNLKRLGQNVVLIYPLVLEDRLEIILATAYSQPIHVAVAVSYKELNQTVVNFRSALINRHRNAKKYAKELFQWLIAPIENQLKGIKADTILYAPDGVLRYVPLAALYDGQQWMVQRFKINNITSYSTNDLETKPLEKPKLLAAAFTQGDFSFEVGEQGYNFKGLRYANEEVDGLNLLYPGMLKLVDEAFNPASVIPELYSFNIVHFATHAALVSGKPYESFILFGNGERVTVERIKDEFILPNVDLIVLSACETALGGVTGKGEEILGLGYLMERAGAKATLASLWSVDDGGTQYLMNQFYRNLKQLQMTKVEALQKAQLTMLDGQISSADQVNRGVQLAGVEQKSTDKSVYQHPYFWAPFILIGNGL